MDHPTILYIANVRFPSEKAYSMAIHNQCQVFAAEGCNIKLIVPRRLIKKLPGHDNPQYAVVHLPTLDFFRSGISGRFAFFMQTVTFELSLFIFCLFRSRKIVIYTRDPLALFLRFLGYCVFFECHSIPSNSIYNFLMRRASGIVTISETLQSKLFSIGVQKNKCVVARSGVDLTIFDFVVSKDEARTRLALPLSAKIVLYAGKFTTVNEDKGLIDIISAMQELSNILCIAIGGTETEIASYREKAIAANVQDRVMLLPHTSQSELALYQKASDILLMPFPDIPRYRSQMSPLKMFEYMVAQRPIIATDLPTIREVLDEESACIVPPGNSHALANAIQLVLRDASYAQKIAAAAYLKIGEYSWSTRTKAVLSFISKQLATP